MLRAFLFCYILCLPVLLEAQPTDHDPMVRVRIIHNADSLRMLFNHDWPVAQSGKILSTADSIITVKAMHDKIFLLKARHILHMDTAEIIMSGQPGTVTIFDVPYGIGWWWEGKEDRTYEGELRIYRTAQNKIDVTIHLPLELYLKGVVPYEIGADSPLEALKAQAVAARSEAVMALSSALYSGPHHDLTSDVECQVFSGNGKRTALSDEAVTLTAGLILTEQGQPINAYYASNCGGHSEQIENIWPERPAPQTYRRALSDTYIRKTMHLDNQDSIANWIQAKPLVFCNPYLETELQAWSRKNFRWKKTADIDTLSKMLSGDNQKGRLIDIKALRRGPSGRIYQARFIFEKDSFEVSGELNIRRLWRPALRSSCFITEKTDSTFTLLGAGWGHGVGMCQSGAIAQAGQGSAYSKILKHYYPHTQLISFYSKEFKEDK